MIIRSFLTASFTLGLLLAADSNALWAQADSVAVQTLPTEPIFSLQATADDSPQMAKKKAALRLFKSFQVTLGQLKACQASHEEAGKAIGAFGQRNGNTLALVMKEIKNLGGITTEIRSTLDAEVAEAITAPSVSCQTLVEDVVSGKRDIYKGPQHQDDYKLISSK